MDEDYYKILGISRNSSAEVIKKAYRDLARKYHPDTNPEDKTAKEKFQRVQRAFDVLGDAEKREMYDRYGSSFESMGARGPGGAARRTYAGSEPTGFEDIDFSQFFGERYGPSGGAGFEQIFKQFSQGRAAPRRAPSSTPRKGADLSHELEIPFKTSVIGGEARLSVRHGDSGTETISVKIPAGIEHGKKIRLRGQGEPSPARGKPGDILITVHVSEHPYYSRNGNHLEIKVPVTLAEAALGAKIDLPTPKGTITLTVPPGSSSGKRLRIKGHGIAPHRGKPGDLFAELQIVLPESIDEKSAELLKRLDKNWKLNPRSELQW